MKALLLAILSCIICNVYAQSDSTISFVAHWNKGDEKNYRITKKQTRVQNGEETLNQVSEYDIKCTVVDSTSLSYTLEWEFENALLSKFKIPLEISEKIEKYKIIKVQYVTNELGKFIEVVNWTEIRDLMMELFEKLSDLASEDSMDFPKLLEPFINIYDTKEGITNLVLQDILVFHYPMGLEFNIYDTLYYEELLPNLLGGEPIKGNGQIYFESYNRELDRCMFISELKLDSTDFKSMVNQIMSGFLENREYTSLEEKRMVYMEVKAEFSKMNINIEDYNVFSYYYYPGWPINIHTKRTATITSIEGKGYKVDEILIDEID